MNESNSHWINMSTLADSGLPQMFWAEVLSTTVQYYWEAVAPPEIFRKQLSQLKPQLEKSLMLVILVTQCMLMSPRLASKTWLQDTRMSVCFWDMALKSKAVAYDISCAWVFFSRDIVFNELDAEVLETKEINKPKLDNPDEPNSNHHDIPQNMYTWVCRSFT